MRRCSALRAISRSMSTSASNMAASCEASTSTAPPPGLSTFKRAKLAHKLNYRDGLFLAPMVRCGTLPSRLLALDYGASLVWGPETIDRAIIGTERTVDEASGTIKYLKKGKSIWECHPVEKSRLIYQIGSSDPELALQAAKIIQGDVSGVDLNCGCPKDFSLKGGMGAALLKTPDMLCAILRNLVNNLSVPVSAKIRLLPEQDATLVLVKQIIETGISCLTVHCRTQTMRDREPALLHRLRDIVDLVKPYGIPVVANGDCWGLNDRERICEQTGVTSIMIARGAEANPSCFSSSGLSDPISTILPRYVRTALYVDNHFSNSKYCLCAMDLTTGSSTSKIDRHKVKADLMACKTYEQLCKLVGLDYEKVKGEKDMEVILPGLKGKLESQDGEIDRVTKEDVRNGGLEELQDDNELKHKAPHNAGTTVTKSTGGEDSAVIASKKYDHSNDTSSPTSSTKENDPAVVNVA